MATLEELGIRVTQTGVNEAKAELISYGTVGEQSAAKVKAALDTSGRSSQVLAGQLNALTQMTTQWNSAGVQAQDMARKLAEDLAREGEMAGASAAQVQQLAEAQRVLVGNTEAAVVATQAETRALVSQDVAASTSVAGLGRIRQGLVSLIAQSTGTIPVLDRIGVAFLGMGAGSGVVLGLVAGVAAVAFAYKELTEDSRKAQEAQEKLTKALADWYRTRAEGEAGVRGRQVNAQQSQLAQDEAQLTSLQQTQTPGGFIAGGVNAQRIAVLKQQIQNEKILIAAGRADIDKLWEDSFNKERDQQIAALAERLKFNASDATARKSALDLLKQDQALYVQYLKLPDTVDNSALVATMAAQIAALKEALDPAKAVRAELSELEKEAKSVADAMDRITKSLKEAKPEWTLNRANYELITGELKELNKVADQVAVIGARNAKATNTQSRDWLDMYDKMQKSAAQLSNTLEHDVLGAIAHIGDRGTISFSQLFESTQRLAEKFTSDYASELTKQDSLLEQSLKKQEAANAASITDRIADLKRYEEAAKLVFAGLSGASIGFGIGQQSGNTGVGVFGGAAAGAAAGFASGAGPVGAIIGGLAGAVGGLLGASKAQQEAAKAIKDSIKTQQQREDDFIHAGQNPMLEAHHQLNVAYESLYETLDQEKKKGQISQSDYDTRYGALHGSYVDQYQKINDDFWKGIGQQLNALNGPAGAYANQLDALHDQYVQNLASAEAVHASEEDRLKITELYTKSLDALNKAYKQANVDAQNSYALRIFNANGDSDSAFALTQQIEYQKVLDQGLDDISLGLLRMAQQAEKDQREREKQTQLLQGQLSVAQQSLEQYKAVYDSLTQFKASLSIGQYSPLSPRQQLDAARGQLNADYQLALGGDVNAGNQFAGLSQQFLQASRGYNASGAGYVMDFNSVSMMTDALQQAFGTRVSDTQQQINLLQAQIDKLNGIQQGIIDLGTTLVTVNNTLISVQQAAARATIDGMSDISKEIEDGANDVRRGLEGVKSVLARVAL